MSLTDLLIKKLKPPPQGQKTYFDGAQKGFGVRVSKGGTKTFVLVHGKERKIHSLGRYPDLSLAEARRRAKEALGKAVAERGGSTMPQIGFATLRQRFPEDSALHTRPSTLSEYTRLLTKYFPFEKEVSQVTRADVMEALGTVKHHRSMEQHCFVAIRTLMNWAVRHGYLVASPVPPLRYSTVSRSRILSDEELSAVWKRAGEVGYPFGTMVQLLILTGQRRGEIAALRRSWVSADTITFPASITKNKREHRIPIGKRTREILEGIPGEADMYFPARGRVDVPFAGWSKAKTQFDEALTFTDYTLHDLRRTYSSNLAKLGVPIHVTEKLLNHVSGTLGGIAGVYNRHSYWEEMCGAVSAGNTIYLVSR